MRKLLNTLFVTTQGAYLSKKDETVLVRVEDETKLRLPIHTLEGIVCFGQVSCSPFLMGFCCERGVGLSFCTEHGKFLARATGRVSGNVLLRKAQYRTSEDQSASAGIAQNIIVAKIANCRQVVQRGIREDHILENDVLGNTAQILSRILEELRSPLDLDCLRGKEGEAARCYFSSFGALITAERDSFHFDGRNRRPPLDRVNALLSFVYTLLCHDVVSALESVGLDPQVGFLHRDRPGRPSLALDIMEELRPVLADRLVLTLINRRQINSTGFNITESGGVVMDEETRKTVIVSYQKRKQDEITHTFIEEKIPLGLIPYTQALLLARHLRGDIDGYPPFRWR